VNFFYLVLFKPGEPVALVVSCPAVDDEDSFHGVSIAKENGRPQMESPEEKVNYLGFYPRQFCFSIFDCLGKFCHLTPFLLELILPNPPCDPVV